MKGALHERARCSANAGSVTISYSMHAIPAAEAAQSLYTSIALLLGITVSILVVYASYPPQREDSTPVHARLAPGSASKCLAAHSNYGDC